MNASTLTGQLQALIESGKQSRHLGKSQFLLQTTVWELEQIVQIKKITDLIMDISYIYQMLQIDHTSKYFQTSI